MSGGGIPDDPQHLYSNIQNENGSDIDEVLPKKSAQTEESDDDEDGFIDRLYLVSICFTNFVDIVAYRMLVVFFLTRISKAGIINEIIMYISCD